MARGVSRVPPKIGHPWCRATPVSRTAMCLITVSFQQNFANGLKQNSCPSNSYKKNFKITQLRRLHSFASKKISIHLTKEFHSKSFNSSNKKVSIRLTKSFHWDAIKFQKLSSTTLSTFRWIDIHFLSNWMEYIWCCDSFPFELEPNGILFGSISKGKLLPQSYSIQFEKEMEISFCESNYRKYCESC